MEQGGKEEDEDDGIGNDYILQGEMAKEGSSVGFSV